MKKIIILLSILASFTTFSQVEWASSIHSFSSEFEYEKYPQQYRAKQVLGKPNVSVGSGESALSWTPLKANGEEVEYIDVRFTNPIKIQQLIINENYNSGAVFKVETVDSLNNYKVVHVNINDPKVVKGNLNCILIPKTDYRVFGVKVYLKCNKVGGHNQIDAIGVSSSSTPYQLQINEIEIADSIVKMNLGNNVNFSGDDIMPVISPDGSKLYYARKKHPNNFGDPGQHIWEVNLLDSILRSKILPKTVNLPGSSAGLLSITPDGLTGLFLNAYQPDGTVTKGLSIATKNANGWQTPKAINVQDYYNDNIYAEFTLSNSGKYIIGSIQRKDTKGSKDLYLIRKINDSLWAAPVQLKGNINTAESEGTPFLASDDATLYFSTKGHLGYGNNDIFMTKRLDSTWLNWSEPINLGSKLNTPKWDAYYTIPANGEYVYFVSNGGENRKSDIFRANLPAALRPNPVGLIKGIVRNSETNEVISAEITYSSLSTNKEVGTANSDESTGAYQIVLPGGTNYGFSAKKEGFLPVSEQLDLSEISAYEEIQQDLYLVPIKKDAKIVINNLYFDTGKWDIRSESFVELNQLAEILKTNQSVTIEIGGHTDSDGSSDSNKTLSKNRSQSVVTYLMNQGIEKSRLISKGYGETIPRVDNTTEENKQLNRRVELKVISI